MPADGKKEMVDIAAFWAKPAGRASARGTRVTAQVTAYARRKSAGAAPSVEAILLQVVAQRALADAHQLRRVLLDPVRLFERAANGLASPPIPGSRAGASTAAPMTAARRRPSARASRGSGGARSRGRRRVRWCFRARARCPASRSARARPSRRRRRRRCACRCRARSGARKCSTSSGMSSRRSRSGGIVIGMTFRR